MSAVSLSLCAAALLVAWWAAWRRRIDGWPVWAASLAAPLAVTLVVLFATPRFGDLRVALEGLAFELAPGETVRVGGMPETDHLVVSDLPPGFLVFEARDGSLVARLRDVPKEVVEVGEDPLVQPVAVVRVGDDGFHNAARLEDGAVLRAAGGEWRFTDGMFVAEDGTAGPPLPGRRDALGLPILRHLPPDIEIWPLAFYGRSEGESAPMPTGAFVYRDGFLNLTPYLTLTEPGSVLRPAEGGPVGYRSEVFELAAGEEREVALYRVDRIEPEAEGVLAAGRSRTQERRSFRAHWDGSRVTLALDTPLYVRLEPEDLKRLRDAPGAARDDALLAVTGSAGDASVAGDEVMLLSFPILGTPLATEVFSRITLLEEGARVVTHDRSRRFEFGDAIPVGDHATAILRISKLGTPRGALALLWATALAALAAGFRLRREPVVLILLTGAEWCLAYRLLLAYEGALLDPAAAGAAWRSLAAWAWVPFVLQTALVLYRRGRIVPPPKHLTHGAVALMAAAVVMLQLPLGDGWKAWGLRLAALLLPPLLALTAGRGLGMLDRLLGRVPAWRGRISDGGGEVFWTLAILVITVVGLRLGALFVMGWKEAVTIAGRRLAVSIFMTPGALLLFALLWPARRRWRAPWALGVMLLVLYGLVPIAARDWGIPLVFSLPPILLFATAVFERRPAGLRWLYALPLLLTFGIHLVLGTSLLGRLAPFGQGDVLAEARQSETVARDLLAERAEADANRLRLWSRAAPEVLQRVGTSRSESLAIVMEHLEAFSSRGAVGEGYLGVPLTAPLRATHLDDNLSAVHVLGGFGWLGALALLGPLLFWGLAPAIAGDDPVAGPAIGPPWSAQQAFGWMVVWTFPVAALYMFSANVGMVLFTGKNVYFLAAASLSDAVEATLLVLLALWALASGRPDAEPAPPEPPPVVEAV